MGWFMLRRSRSFAGSQGRRFPRRGGGPSRVPARAVLLLLAMVAALAPRAFAQTTPDPGERWTPGGGWTHDVTTTSLVGKLMLQQSVTIAGGSQIWDSVAIDACPWTRVEPPLPSTPSCDSLKAFGQIPGSPFRNDPLTVSNFSPTQAMIDNGGVVIRLRWSGYSSTAGDVGMTEWVPLVPPPSAALVLTPASISEAGGVSTVTATLDRTTSAATTITVSAAAVSPAVAGDYALSTATTLTIAAGDTTSTGTVTITANDNDVDAADKTVTVSGTAAGAGAAPSDMTLTIADDDTAGFTFVVPAGELTVTAGGSAESYTAALTSAPTGTVTVSVTSDNADVTVNPTSLTFTNLNWNTPQTVTVTAAADGDDYADGASLTHDATGGGYDGVTGALSVAVAGGARIAVSATRTESVYVVNGQRVTVVALGVPAGVEIDLPSSLGAAVTASFAPAAADVPRESARFSLAHGGERVMVDVTVDPVPTGGLTLCLAAPQGIRDAAGRSPGRELVLLRYADGAWAPVTGSAWDATRMRGDVVLALRSGLRGQEHRVRGDGLQPGLHGGRGD